jgi:hypothetical protein
MSRQTDWGWEYPAGAANDPNAPWNNPNDERPERDEPSDDDGPDMWDIQDWQDNQ